VQRVIRVAARHGAPFLAVLYLFLAPWLATPASAQVPSKEYIRLGGRVIAIENAPTPDLTVTVTHTGNFTQGQTGAVYTITVTNSGGAPTVGTVTLVDALPAKLTATAMAGTGWNCTLSTKTCTRSDALAAGPPGYPIALTVDVAPDAPGSVTNSASVSGGGDGNTNNNGADDETTIVGGPPDLTVAKSHTGNFTQGQTGAAYTITVSNSGGSATTGTVTVVDTLPESLTATAMSGSGWTCTVGTKTCSRSDSLALASSYPSITLTVNVAAGAPSSVVNAVTVSGGGESNSSNDTATDYAVIGSSLPDLTVSKSHQGSFTQGQTGATYSITVTNSGTGPTAGTVTIVDTLPTGLTATGMSGTGWSCNVSTKTCTRSSVLNASQSYPSITLTVTVAQDAPPSVANTVTVSGGGETNSGNDVASDATTIGSGSADLTIYKSHFGYNFFQGQIGAPYAITVTNSGVGSTSGAVTVVDTPPASLTVTNMYGPGWACMPSTRTCGRYDALAPGTSYPVIYVTVDVASNAPASVTNVAAVAGGGDNNPSNNSVSDPTTVLPAQPDLGIVKQHSGNFTQGQVGAVYAVYVSNSGTGPSSGTVTVADILPAGLSATAMSGTGWNCNLSTRTCTRSDPLAYGSVYPAISLTVNVALNAPASVTNVATVSGGGDSNGSNNSAGNLTVINSLPIDLLLENMTVTSLMPDYLAHNSITGQNNFIVSGAGVVTFRAGSTVRLEPGFQATAGTAAMTFHAYIDPTLQ
jgi:uncharacterized repeat protein (TIGR01451 family)